MNHRPRRHDLSGIRRALTLALGSALAIAGCSSTEDPDAGEPVAAPAPDTASVEPPDCVEQLLGHVDAYVELAYDGGSGRPVMNELAWRYGGTSFEYAAVLGAAPEYMAVMRQDGEATAREQWLVPRIVSECEQRPEPEPLDVFKPTEGLTTPVRECVSAITVAAYELAVAQVFEQDRNALRSELSRVHGTDSFEYGAIEEISFEFATTANVRGERYAMETVLRPRTEQLCVQQYAPGDVDGSPQSGGPDAADQAPTGGSGCTERVLEFVFGQTTQPDGYDHELGAQAEAALSEFEFHIYREVLTGWGESGGGPEADVWAREYAHELCA